MLKTSGPDKLVGATGFEPATSATPLQRATKLRHAPILNVNDLVVSEYETYYTRLFF